MTSYAVVGTGGGSGTIGVTLTSDVPCSTDTDGSILVALFCALSDFGASDTYWVRPQSYWPVGAPAQFFQPLVDFYDCYTNGIDWVAFGTFPGFDRIIGHEFGGHWYGSVVTDELITGTTLLFDVTGPASAMEITLVNLVGVIPDGLTVGHSTGIGLGSAPVEVAASAAADGYLIGSFGAEGRVSGGSCCFGSPSGPWPAGLAYSSAFDSVVMTFSGGDSYYSAGSTRFNCDNIPALSDWQYDFGVIAMTAGSTVLDFGPGAGQITCDVFGRPHISNVNWVQDGWEQSGIGFSLGGVPYCGAGPTGPTGPTGPGGPGTLVLSTHFRGATGPGEV